MRVRERAADLGEIASQGGIITNASDPALEQGSEIGACGCHNDGVEDGFELGGLRGASKIAADRGGQKEWHAELR